MKICRFCSRTGMHQFLDLGHQPLSNSFLTQEQLNEPEITYPLKLYVCDSCWLVQVEKFKGAEEIFKEDYPYYSSESPANVSHAKEYVEMMMERFEYNENSQVIEIGGNDGYLLQHFPPQVSILNIEPSRGPAIQSLVHNIPTHAGFFSAQLAKEIAGRADLICGINVLAHQPDINDFVEGLRIALKPDGVITMEFPHLMNLIEGCQFDTVYQEHYSYFSFGTVCEIFGRHGLDVFDVDEIPEHGGSLRIYAEHKPSKRHSEKIRELLLREAARMMFYINYYQNFQDRVEDIKLNTLQFLIEQQEVGKSIVAYGCAAKGNTFLNYCGIRDDLIAFAVDRSKHKQNKFLPGSHIPVYGEEDLKRVRPDYVLVLPWNLKGEIMEQLKYIRQWGGKFVVAIPELEVI